MLVYHQPHTQPTQKTRIKHAAALGQDVARDLLARSAAEAPPLVYHFPYKSVQDVWP